MPFWKNHKRDKKDSPENEKSLNPVLHVMGSLKDYHTEMVSRQMNGLFYEGFSEEEQKQFEQYLARILETLIKNLHTN